MLPVIEYTKTEFIKQLDSANKLNAIEELALVFKDADVCGDIDSLISALKEREDIMSTGIGFGVAIPHTKINTIKEMAFAIGISRAGIDFGSTDGKLVHLIILVAAGEKQHNEYLRLLSNIMGIVIKDTVKESIINAPSSEEVLNILQS